MWSVSIQYRFQYADLAIYNIDDTRNNKTVWKNQQSAHNTKHPDAESTAFDCWAVNSQSNDSESSVEHHTPFRH